MAEYANITDLPAVLDHWPFYDLLARYPPELTIPFLRQIAWQDDVRSGRLKALKERAARLFWWVPAEDRQRAQDRFVAYMVTRMVDPLFAHLYATNAEVFARHVTIEGQDRWDAAHEQFGRAVLVSPHWGPYLATPMLLRQLGMRITIPIDATIVPMWEAVMTHCGEDLTLTRYVGIPGPSATGRLAANLEAGYTPFITPDFNLGRPGGVMVSFLDRPLPATTGPARLALSASVPVLPVVLTLVDPLHYRLAFEAPLFWPGREQPALEDLTRRIYAWMDGAVRRDPAVWWGWIVYDTPPPS